MRRLSLCLTVLGVCLSAFYGSQISPDLQPKQVMDGQLYFQRAAAESAQAKYCETRAQFQLEDIDGCGESSRYAAVAEDRIHIDANDDLSPREQQYRDIALLESVEASLIDPRVQSSRDQWVLSLKAVLPILKQQSLLPRVNPSNHWMGFASGMFLMVLGGLVFRRAEANAFALQSASESTSENTPMALMKHLCDELEGLNRQVQALDTPMFSQLEETKIKLESLQKNVLGPLIDQGPQLQSKYGLSGYASVFSPLSSGERLLNRTWSTLVDQHWPEARRSLNDATAHCLTAHQQLTTLESRRV